MKTAVLFTSHFHRQPRRGGFHWIADGLRALGWNVRFITVDFSMVTLLKGDRRTRHGEAIGVNQLVDLEEQLQVGVLRTLTHPIGSGSGLKAWVLNRLTYGYPGGAMQRVLEWSAGADMVLFESNASLFFAPAIRAASDAVLIYRVSDNLSAIRAVPSLLAAERRAASLVDLVSLASPSLARSYEGAGNVRLDPMGLDKAQFDAAMVSPYPDDGRVRVVCSGTSGLDAESFARAAEAFPEWEFVLIGDTPHPLSVPNIRKIGEIPFAEVVPLVKHADIGFAPYIVRPGFEYQAEHSNRLLQYTYSRLASVVPDALCSDKAPGFVGYRANDAESIAAAFRAAQSFDRSLVPAERVLSWSELAARLAATGRR